MKIKDVNLLLWKLSKGEIPDGSLDMENAEQLIDSLYIHDHIKAWPKHMHKAIAERLVDFGKYDMAHKVFGCIEQFYGVNQKELALRAIKNGGTGWGLLLALDGPDTLRKFHWADQEVAEAVIRSGHAWVVSKNPQDFKNLDPKEIVYMLAQCGEYSYIEEFMKNFKNKAKEG